MEYSNEWNEAYKNNSHMSIWPWSDLVSCVYRYAHPKDGYQRVLELGCGAGANIPLVCDLVLAARSASFIQAFCKIGLIPDSGGTWTLPRLVGMARAKALALLGNRLSAEQAEQWGLIYRCVDDAELRDEALTLARHLATQPTYGLALIKRSLNASLNNSFDQQLELERDLQRLAGRSEDYREGISAFMEKRSPSFKGR